MFFYQVSMEMDLFTVKKNLSSRLSFSFLLFEPTVIPVRFSEFLITNETLIESLSPKKNRSILY